MMKTRDLLLSFFALSVSAHGLHAQSFTTVQSGAWNDPATWGEESIFPTAASGPVMITAPFSVTLGIGITIDEVTVESGATLAMTSGDIIMGEDGPFALDVSGTWIFTGGAISGSGSTRVAQGGAFQWSGGTLHASLTLDLLPGSNATFNGGVDFLTNNGTINNAGIWNMESGTLYGTLSQFNNLPTGVVNLNGWQLPGSSWQNPTHNEGVINKFNGDIPFTFIFSDFTNNGVVHIHSGELNMAASSHSTINNGSILGLGPGTELRTNTAFVNAPGGIINGLDSLRPAGASFTVEPGSTIQHLPYLIMDNGILNSNIPMTTDNLWLTGGVLNCQAGITVQPGGTCLWTASGSTGNSNILHLPQGTTTTFASTGTSANAGVINHAGLWNMENGTLFASGEPSMFNNLPTGVVNLNGWISNTNSWQNSVNNSGLINLTNSGELFTVSTGTFTNLAGGVLSIPGGTMLLNVIMPEQQGTFLIGEDVVLTTPGFPFAGDLIENNGTILSTQLTMQGSGTKQLTGTGSVNNLRFDGSGDTELNGDWTVTNTANFVNGRLLLGENDLVVSNPTTNAVQGGNATSHVVTDGSGRLVREVGTGNHVFPIGTGSNYLPITLNVTDGPQERFAAGVQDGVHRDYAAPGVPDGLLVSSGIVERTWVLTEETPGDNTATVTFQWNPIDEAQDFDRSNCAVARYDGELWSSDGYDSAEGGGPFNRTLTGITAFREFTVADADADLNGISTQVTARNDVRIDLHVWPNPAQNVLHIAMERTEALLEVSLIDIQGRRLAVPASMQSDRMTLQLSDIPTGTYLLELIDRERRVLRRPVIVAR